MRTDVGTISETNYGYTNQEAVPDLGLMDYNARFYDAYLNRWTQPDTIIPNPYSSQGWNRFSYVQNNPIRYNDPSGHSATVCSPGDACGGQYQYGPGGLDENAQNLGINAYDSTGVKQARNRKIAEKTFEAVETVATALFEPLDWINMAGHCAIGECSWWYALALLPIIPGSIAKHGDDVAELVGKYGDDVVDAARVEKKSGELLLYYPPNQGFLADANELVLQEGDVIARRGNEYGRFFSPSGLSPADLSLPPSSANLPENLFVVNKPFTVYSGPVAPWFNQPGGGVQYYSPVMNQKYLLDEMFISSINP